MSGKARALPGLSFKAIQGLVTDVTVIVVDIQRSKLAAHFLKLPENLHTLFIRQIDVNVVALVTADDVMRRGVVGGDGDADVMEHSVNLFSYIR